MLLLFWKPAAAVAVVALSSGGGGFYDPQEEYLNSFAYWQAKQTRFEAALAGEDPVLLEAARAALRAEDTREGYYTSDALWRNRGVEAEAAGVAWELGDGGYAAGAPVSIGQFATRVLETAEGRVNPMHEALAAVDARHEILRLERVLRVAKVGAAAYVLYRVLAFAWL